MITSTSGRGDDGSRGFGIQLAVEGDNAAERGVSGRFYGCTQQWSARRHPHSFYRLVLRRSHQSMEVSPNPCRRTDAFFQLPSPQPGGRQTAHPFTKPRFQRPFLRSLHVGSWNRAASEAKHRWAACLSAVI